MWIPTKLYTLLCFFYLLGGGKKLYTTLSLILSSLRWEDLVRNDAYQACLTAILLDCSDIQFFFPIFIFFLVKHSPLLFNNLPISFSANHAGRPLPHFLLAQGSDLWILSYSSCWIFCLSAFEREEKQIEGGDERTWGSRHLPVITPLSMRCHPVGSVKCRPPD